MIHGREQAVSVRGKVDTHNLWTLVGHYIEEAWVLVRESVMILAPYSCCKKNVEGRYFGPPVDFKALLQPFTVLVDHRVDDVNEGLIRVEQTVSAGQHITLEPPLLCVLAPRHFHEEFWKYLNRMLRKHLHNASTEGKITAVPVFFEIITHPHFFAALSW